VGEQKKSPINGVPTPRGRPFTSETGREARRKRTEKEKNAKTISAALIKRLQDTFEDPRTGKQMTGADILAEAIIKGAINGNAKMIEIALEINGEKARIGINADVEDLSPLAEMLRR
jgi:hypothetical protein